MWDCIFLTENPQFYISTMKWPKLANLLGEWGERPNFSEAFSVGSNIHLGARYFSFFLRETSRQTEWAEANQAKRVASLYEYCKSVGKHWHQLTATLPFDANAEPQNERERVWMGMWMEPGDGSETRRTPWEEEWRADNVPYMVMCVYRYAPCHKWPPITPRSRLAIANTHNRT